LPHPALNSNIYRNEETIKSNVKISEPRENDKLYEKTVFLDEHDQKLARQYYEERELKRQQQEQ